MVKTLRFADVEVPVPGFGAMGISFALGKNLTYEQAEPVLLRALELGCTFWDTAVRVGERTPTPGSTDRFPGLLPQWCE
jgi:aryl-alcohol dehydrogenase-like predicted oxidoreductase